MLTCVWFSIRNSELGFYPHINTIRIILLLNLAHPAQVWLQHISDCIIVIVIDVHPRLDAQSRVSHPVIVVATPRSGIIRCSHHSSTVLNIKVGSVVGLHGVEELISEARSIRDPVVVAAVSSLTSIRVEAPGSVSL